MESCNWTENIPADRSKAIEELVRGRESTKKLITLLATNDKSLTNGDSVSLDQLVTQIQSSFANTLAILMISTNSSNNNGGVSDSDEVSFPARKSEESGESSKCTQPPLLKDRRGCYKRRKAAHSWTKDATTLVDDGHAWRKYGQKSILNSKYPRNYFRCTHKYDQQCQATKQVQRLDEEPTVYRTTYYGHHTCSNPLKASQLLVDPSDHTDSSKLLSFAASGNHTDMMSAAPIGMHLTNNSQPHPFFRSVKQEEFHATSTSRREDVPGSSTAGAHHQSSSSSGHDSTFYLSSPDDHRDDKFEHHAGADVISTSCTTSAHDSFGFDDSMIGHVDHFADDVLQLIHF